MGEWRRVVGTAAALAVLVLGCGMVLGIHLELVVAGLALGVVVAVTATAAWVAVRHGLLARHLRRVAQAMEIDGVVVETVPGLDPLVAGLVRPRVFGCRALFQDLPEGQRRAVLLHELAHRQHHDPGRLVLLEAVRRCLGWMPAVADLEASARARLEIRADRFALRRGASRRELAAAMLRLADAGAATTPAFGALTDQRLRALLGDEEPSQRRSAVQLVAVVAAATVAALTCTSLLAGTHPEFTWILRCLRSACSGAG